MNLLIAGAVESELSLLKVALNALPAEECAGRSYSRAHVGDLTVFLGDVGIGVVSAALTLGALVARLDISRLIMCGSAGAFEKSGLQTGDVAVVSSEILAEAGLCTGKGMGSADALGLPDLVQEIALDAGLVHDLQHAADSVTRARAAKSLTVVGVSSDLYDARARAEVFDVAVENMEGYAAALVGMRYGIPAGEVRGISNKAGNRDKGTWNLPLADELAQKAVLNYLRSLAG